MKRLRSVQNERRDFPPQTEAEAEMYYCREMICQLKIEAERRRVNLRIDYAFSHKKTIKKVEGGMEISKTITSNGWEKADDLYRQAIDERETKGVEFYTNIINNLRDGKPTTSTTNEPAKV